MVTMSQTHSVPSLAKSHECETLPVSGYPETSPKETSPPLMTLVSQENTILRTEVHSFFFHLSQFTFMVIQISFRGRWKRWKIFQCTQRCSKECRGIANVLTCATFASSQMLQEWTTQGFPLCHSYCRHGTGLQNAFDFFQSGAILACPNHGASRGGNRQETLWAFKPYQDGGDHRRERQEMPPWNPVLVWFWAPFKSTSLIKLLLWAQSGFS